MQMKFGNYYYDNNDDVVTTVAQCGDYIRGHAADLIGKVVGDKHGEIQTAGIDISIRIEPDEMPTITVMKDTKVPLTLPFSED